MTEGQLLFTLDYERFNRIRGQNCTATGNLDHSLI